MRNAASCCQPRVVSWVPRAARIGEETLMRERRAVLGSGALGAVPTHAVVVLLVRRGRQRMHTGGHRQQLVVRDQRGGGVLQEHIARVEARVAGEEGGQLGEETGEHPKEPSLRNTSELAEPNGRRVERQGKRLTMKV